MRSLLFSGLQSSRKVRKKKRQLHQSRTSPLLMHYGQNPNIMFKQYGFFSSKINKNMIHTLGAEMFGMGDFWLETRIIIKILSHPWYPRTFDWFSCGWRKKNPKKNLKNWVFQNCQFSKMRKFQGLVLGLVGLIDAKGIDVV